MRYLRCKCGGTERWDSGGVVHACEGCEKCNTTFAADPSEHHPLQPHQWKDVVETVSEDGVVVRREEYKTCKVCGTIRVVEGNTYDQSTQAENKR